MYLKRLDIKNFRVFDEEGVSLILNSGPGLSMAGAVNSTEYAVSFILSVEKIDRVLVSILKTFVLSDSTSTLAFKYLATA